MVPGPSTAMSTPVFAPRKFSATRDVIGSTVDEPEMFSDPETSPPPLALLLLFELQATAAKATVESTTTVELIPLMAMPDPPLIASCGARRAG